MQMDGVIDIKKPEPDSQYRLRNCRVCKSDDVAYVHYDARGGEAWKVCCFSCGHTVDKGLRARHAAQVAWNEEAVSADKLLIAVDGGDYGKCVS